MHRIGVAFFLLSIILASGCGGQAGLVRAKEACAGSGMAVSSYNTFSGSFRCAPKSEIGRQETKDSTGQ